MKKLLFMVIGLMFAAQAAFASPMGDRMNLETLNKSDAQVLFQDNTMSQHVVVLNKGQMNELKGKSWSNEIMFIDGIHVFHPYLRLHEDLFRLRIRELTYFI